MTALLDSDIAEICSTLGPAAQAFSGKRILITGARGFLGRYFTDVFVKLNETVLEAPCEIIAIDNLITAGALGASRGTARGRWRRLRRSPAWPALLRSCGA